MAKITSLDPELLAALRTFGVEPDNTRRVIIDIDINNIEPVRVYTEQIGTDGTTPVILALDSAKVYWEKSGE